MARLLLSPQQSLQDQLAGVAPDLPPRHVCSPVCSPGGGRSGIEPDGVAPALLREMLCRDVLKPNNYNYSLGRKPGASTLDYSAWALEPGRHLEILEKATTPQAGSCGWLNLIQRATAAV